MNTRQVATFTATLHVGLQEGYDGALHSLNEARALCQQYVDEVGLCVSLREVQYVYTGNTEPGVEIGPINYPRFPSTPEVIKRHAYTLAEILMVAFKQERMSIVSSDETVVLERDGAAPTGDEWGDLIAKQSPP